MNLLAHQITAAEEFVRRDGRLLLWADTGTGKTAAAIESWRRVGRPRLLYLAPAILKKQLAVEFSKFAPEASVMVIQGAKKDRALQWARGYEVVIANYELLLADTKEVLAYAPQMIVADECQRLAAPASQTIKAFRKLDPKYRLAMSGTPAPNHLHEFWNMTSWVKPGLFYDSFWAFRARECRMNPNFPQILGYYDKAKVQTRFMSVVHRIPRDKVLQLPPLTEIRIDCRLGKEQREAYEKLKRELCLELANGEHLTVPNMLALIMRLRQMADLPEALGVKAESAKEKTLASLLEAVSSRKILVFTEFASVARYLEWKYGKEALAVMGETPQGDRDAIFERFRTDPSVRILFLTSAAQYGVNLQAADTVIHFDLPWNEARMDQRNARAWRYGQDKAVTSYRIVAEDTVDEKMERMIEGKRKATVTELMEFFK
jgi:SNF2 family DNA or RNA helicase